MHSGRSNAILLSDLLSQDGPHIRIADDFVRAVCAHCGQPLADDPRFGEWGAYCATCWVELRAV